MTGLSSKMIGQRIRALREQRKLSQDDLAAALGLHRQSISLMEQGKRDLTAMELDKLTRFLQVSFDDIMAPEVRKPHKKEPADLRFQPEKLRQALLYLLTLVGGRANVGETVLYKLLYFCDFNHYQKTGRPITGLTYRRLQFGPVPQRSQFSPVIEDMMDEKMLQRFEHTYFEKPQIRYFALRDPNISILSPEERTTIEAVAQRLGGMNAREIEEYVHHDIPWEATEHQGVISYELAHERSEPYSVWTEEEMNRAAESAQAEDTERDIPPMSAEEIAYYETLPEAR